MIRSNKLKKLVANLFLAGISNVYFNYFPWVILIFEISSFVKNTTEIYKTINILFQKLLLFVQLIPAFRKKKKRKWKRKWKGYIYIFIDMFCSHSNSTSSCTSIREFPSLFIVLSHCKFTARYSLQQIQNLKSNQCWKRYIYMVFETRILKVEKIYFLWFV